MGLCDFHDPDTRHDLSGTAGLSSTVGGWLTGGSAWGGSPMAVPWSVWVMYESSNMM